MEALFWRMNFFFKNLLYVCHFGNALRGFRHGWWGE